jgi:hypothetical protein
MGGDEVTATDESLTPEASRGRSTIAFPYFDQDDAVKVAEAVHAVGGTVCDWDQLAAQMKQAAGGGGFRMRVMTARSFGLLTYDRGTVTLTDLGLRVVDPKQARAARVESFMHVPLYRGLYDRFRGSLLPPPPAIERTLEAMGVAVKQTDKARQAFMRSAKSAGLFELDATRLTMPPALNAQPAATTNDDPRDKGAKGGGDGGDGRDELHPFIQGLLAKLPPPDTDWPVQARAKWLQTAANIFDLMYTAHDETQAVQVTLA